MSPQLRGRRPAGRLGEENAVPALSPFLQKCFSRYARHYVRKHFRALRFRQAESFTVRTDTPVVVYVNHPSWWDPLVCVALAMRLFPERRHFAPMDAEALEHYKFLGRVGLFGVEHDSLRGARTFLRTGEAICRESGTALWVTPQGRISDIRERPVRLEPGLGHLVKRLEKGYVVPVALEYPFWTERLPEVLALIERPLSLEDLSGTIDSAEQWTRLLTQALEHAQDSLSGYSQAREAAAFEVLVSGRSGVGRVYDSWRWARAKLRGQRFTREHGSLTKE